MSIDAFRLVAAPLIHSWRARAAADQVSVAGPSPEAELVALGAPVWPLLHRTKLCAGERVAREAARLLGEAAGAELPPDEAFERLRYCLSPVLLLRTDARAAELLERHLAGTLADFARGSPPVRGRAEEEFCMLGEVAERFLAGESAAAAVAPGDLDALRRSVAWGVWPELRERTGLSMAGWEKLPRRERQMAVSLWKRLAGDDAILLLRRVLRDDPDPPVRDLAAAALYEMEAIDLAMPPRGMPPPQALRVLLIRAGLLRRRAEWERALQILDMLARRLPDDREVHFELGYTLRQAKRFEEALDAFARALALEGGRPVDAFIRYQIAVTLLQCGRYQEAIARFEEELGRDPGDAYLVRALWYDLACALALSGRHEAAIDALLKAIEKGFRDREHLARNDPDLESLRGLEDFKKVLRALDAAEARDRLERRR